MCTRNLSDVSLFESCSSASLLTRGKLLSSPSEKPELSTTTTSGLSTSSWQLSSRMRVKRPSRWSRLASRWRACAQVEEILGQGEQAPSGHIPFTLRAKQVLELSLRESMQLDHDYIGAEHILLGLISEGEGAAAQLLVKLGAELTRVRQQVIQVKQRGESSETLE